MNKVNLKEKDINIFGKDVEPKKLPENINYKHKSNK